MKLFFLFFIAIFIVNVQSRKISRRYRLEKSAREELKTICETSSCKKISLPALARRDAVRQHLIKYGGSGGQQRALDDDTPDVDYQLDLIYEAKKAVLAQNNLQDLIEPHDDGLFGGDLLLDEDQAQWIINQANENQKAQRASAIALDSFPGSRWPSTTINYYIGSNFNKNQTSAIIRGLSMLCEGTCLKFVRVTKPVEPVLRFAPIIDGDAGLCGYANVGYLNYKPNVVNINFESKICAPLIDVTIAHETMHVFGFMHEHSRFDRDDFITINWTNVDPQAMDIFTKDDPDQVNPYCIAYNYQSIMHYDSYVGAKNYSYPTFVAKVRPKYHVPRIGNYAKPSLRDLLLINKLYCVGDDCHDESSACGFKCGNCTSSATYRRKCKRSCDVCQFKKAS